MPAKPNGNAEVEVYAKEQQRNLVRVGLGLHLSQAHDLPQAKFSFSRSDAHINYRGKHTILLLSHMRRVFQSPDDLNPNYHMDRDVIPTQSQWKPWKV